MHTKVSRQKTNKLIPGLIFAILVAGILLLFLEKTNRTDLFSVSKNKPSAGNDTNRLPDTDYTPPTKDEQGAIEERKAELDKQNQSQQPQQSQISVDIKTAIQDVAGGPVFINAVVTGAGSGTCSLELRNNEVIVKKTAPVVVAGTYYSSDGFEIPFSELYPGKWDVSLVVKNNQWTSNNATKDVQIQ